MLSQIISAVFLVVERAGFYGYIRNGLYHYAEAKRYKKAFGRKYSAEGF
jgi:hypothetical protein